MAKVKSIVPGVLPGASPKRRKRTVRQVTPKPAPKVRSIVPGVLPGASPKRRKATVRYVEKRQKRQTREKIEGLNLKSKGKYRPALMSRDEKRKAIAARSARNTQLLLRALGERGELDADVKVVKEGDFKVGGLNLDKITGEGGRAALDILDETTRLGEATAGGFHSQIKRLKEGKVPTPWHAAQGAWESGGSRKNRVTYSDVLREGGVDKVFKGALGEKGGGAATETLGLLGDIGLDPATYVVVGASAPVKAATKVASKGTAKTAKKAAKVEKPRKRVTVSAGGKTAVTPIGLPQMSDGVREGLRKALPLRPANMTETEWAKVQDFDRHRRGFQLSETRKAARKVTAERKALGGARRRFLPERPMEGEKLRVRPGRQRTAPVEASRRVKDARESGDLTKLSRAERAVLKEEVRADRRGLKMRREAGEDPKVYRRMEEGDAKHYAPRLAAFAISDPALRRKVGRAEGWAERRMPSPTGGTRQARKTSTEEDYARKVNRGPLSEVREAKPGFYVEDIPTVRMAKAQKDIGRAANTRYRGEIVSLGKPVTKKPGEDARAPVGEGEAVYRTDQGKLTEVKQKDVPEFANKQPGDLVVLKKTVADHANRQIEGTKRLAFIDPVTNKFKWALTVPNPQYWSRNYYGGLFNAWEEGARGTGLAKGTVAAHKVARRMGRVAKAEETLGAAPKKPAGTIDLGKAGKMNTDDFIREVESQNVSGGGITSELLGAETRRRSRMQTFEDVPRLAAYIHWRRQGLSTDKATRRVMNSQFDYGALTPFEMNWAKRIFPFYTWRSRNIALQAKTLVQRPGKLATFEKTRNALASSMPEDWQTKLQENEALGVPLVIPGTKQMLFPGLPVTDLNVLTASPAAEAQQMMGMLHPAIKSPVEFFTGYSFFFRDRLEGEGRKWYSAPDRLIDRLPLGMADRLEKAGLIRMGKDRWTGEMTWQWRGKTDYLAKLIPITSTAFQVSTSGRSRKGQDSVQRLAGWLTGLRTAPFEPELGELYKKYEERANVQSKVDDLIELRTHKGRDKTKYEKLNKQIGKLDLEIFALEGKAGKKDRTDPRGGAASKSFGEGLVEKYSGGEEDYGGKIVEKYGGSGADDYADEVLKKYGN